MKARRTIPMAPHPSASASLTGQQYNASSYRSLLQDYEHLLKEIKAKRKKLQMITRKKHMLSSEVRFLRRKHMSFSAKPFQETLFKIKKRFRKPPVPSTPVRDVQVSKIHVPDEELNKPKNHELEAANPSTVILIDLNQAAVPIAEC